jgi:hypothetical protein
VRLAVRRLWFVFGGPCRRRLTHNRETLDTLHKTICSIGPGLRIMPEGNFREYSFQKLSEKPRIRPRGGPARGRKEPFGPFDRPYAGLIHALSVAPNPFSDSFGRVVLGSSHLASPRSNTRKRPEPLPRFLAIIPFGGRSRSVASQATRVGTTCSGGA